MDAFQLFGRLFAIVFGYCLACLAAAFFLAFTVPDWAPGGLYLEGWHFGYEGFVDGYRVSGEPTGVIDMLMRLVLAGVGASVIGALAFVPAGLAIVAAEAFRLRGLLYHVVAGGVIAIALLAATWVPADALRSLPPDWNLFLAAGFVGGFVYWLIAGRGSGITGPRQSETRG